jgi:hypothetical protein
VGDDEASVGEVLGDEWELEAGVEPDDGDDVEELQAASMLTPTTAAVTRRTPRVLLALARTRRP